MLVKICGITSEADALLAVGLGADAVGFVFAPSPRQVAPQAVRRIIERVPPEILTVGVFRNEARTRVVDIVNGIGLRAAQLHGDETAQDTAWVAERIPVTIKAFPVGHPGIARIDDYGVDAILVDALSPGSGEVFDWQLAEGVVDPARLIVSGGLRSDNVADAIAHLHPFGVDVSTGVESEPGRKDPGKMRAFIAAARAAAGEATGGDVEDGAPEDDDTGDRPFDWQEDE
ncbi:MAG TPA: phosphoribosylanthranilate isomerase [Acidimicrobiales bacterium]|nr:phosphoribosylanthranilate isomerase [Acidimicrobiales bacterium]